MFTEGIFHSRWALIETYHNVGSRLMTDENFIQHAKGNASCLSQVTQMTGIKERELYRAIQFYNKYPDLGKVPEGKNISWSKIVEMYLPEHSGAGSEDRPAHLLAGIALKRFFTRYWPTEDAPDYARAYALIVELAGLIAKRAK